MHRKASLRAKTRARLFGCSNSAGRAAVVKMLGRDVDVIGPDDRAVFSFGIQEEREIFELEEQGLVEQRASIVDGLLAVGEGQAERIVRLGGRRSYDPVRCFHDDH